MLIVDITNEPTFVGVWLFDSIGECSVDDGAELDSLTVFVEQRRGVLGNESNPIGVPADGVGEEEEVEVEARWGGKIG